MKTVEGYVYVIYELSRMRQEESLSHPVGIFAYFSFLCEVT